MAKDLVKYQGPFTENRKRTIALSRVRIEPCGKEWEVQYLARGKWRWESNWQFHSVHATEDLARQAADKLYLTGTVEELIKIREAEIKP